MTRIRTHTPQVNTLCWLHGYILPNHTTQGHVCGRRKLNVLCGASNCYCRHRPWRSVQLPNTCLCLGNNLHFLGDEPAWALFNLTQGRSLSTLTYHLSLTHTLRNIPQILATRAEQRTQLFGSSTHATSVRHAVGETGASSDDFRSIGSGSKTN